MSQFDEVVDFLVVGSGGGSMCAGLHMRTLGKSVLILEKEQFVGGTTARSGGVLWIPNNPFMKRDSIQDSFEEAATYLDGLAKSGGEAAGSTQLRRHTYIREAPGMIEFLLSQGVRFTRSSYWPDYYDDRPGGIEDGRTVIAETFDLNSLGEWKEKLQTGGFPRLPATLDEAMQLPAIRRSWQARITLLKILGRVVLAKLSGKQFVLAGEALQGRMLQAALRAGVQIRPGSPVSELLLSEGEIKGVVTEKNGKPWRVSARLGVLVNAGGFARNQRMRDQYQPGTSARWTSVAAGDTGEMIEEMMRHGAAIDQMDEMVGYQTTLPPGTKVEDIKPSVQRLTAAPHAMLVDQSGVRYMNEGGSYMAYCKAMFERNKTVPAVPSWAIFDVQFISSYMLAGTMPGKKKPQSWYDENFLQEARTVAELAKKIGVDHATLSATVARFNSFVTANCDEDFHRGDRAYDRWLGDPTHKPSPTLGSIVKPPFYALPVLPGDVGTYGGVVTDDKARVLREDGTVIPGLYATGVSTASVMGRVYPGAGSSIGPSFLWGYLAAKHAAEREA